MGLTTIIETRRKYSFPKSSQLSKIGAGTEGVVYKTPLISIKGIRRVAEKRYYTQVGDPHVSPKQVRIKLINAKRTWKLLKDLNFPVPSFYTPLLRRNKGIFRVLMENLTIKYGKIYPITQNRKPLFLAKLSIKNDSILIKTLAKDLVILHSLGFCPKTMDAWVFYKDKKTYKRLLVDYGNLQTRYKGKEFLKKHHESFVALNSELKEIMGKNEYELFMKEYLKYSIEDIKRPAA
jgi:hypothetical protein